MSITTSDLYKKVQEAIAKAEPAINGETTAERRGRFALICVGELRSHLEQRFGDATQFSVSCEGSKVTVRLR